MPVELISYRIIPYFLDKEKIKQKLAYYDDQDFTRLSRKNKKKWRLLRAMSLITNVKVMQIGKRIVAIVNYAYNGYKHTVVSFATCDTKRDRFNTELGVNIAIQRAAATIADDKSDDDNPVLIKFFKQWYCEIEALEKAYNSSPSKDKINRFITLSEEKNIEDLAQAATN